MSKKRKFWTENKWAERFILFIILLNSIIIFLQENSITSHVLDTLDAICTYDIPNAVAIAMSSSVVGLVRMYFVFILITGGIIGLLLVNSISVDAMVGNNNDELEKEVKSMTCTVEELRDKIKKLNNNQ